MDPKFRDARLRLDEIKKMERRLLAVDHQDALEKAEYVRDLRRAQREAVLDKLTPSRRCPLCGNIKEKSRSWVVLRVVALNDVARQLLKLKQQARTCIVSRGNVAVCRSCVMKWSELHWKK